jgi:hypothetical protein
MQAITTIGLDVAKSVFQVRLARWWTLSIGGGSRAAPKRDLEKRLFYRRRALARFYTAKAIADIRYSPSFVRFTVMSSHISSACAVCGASFHTWLSWRGTSGTGASVLLL